jgi:RNA polymerase sigma-70 factor (ECF subfamily)
LGIARHKALAAARRRSIGEFDDDLTLIEDPADGPEIAAQKADRSAILRECLEQLSPAHREIIDLVYYHEQTIEEVARVIGVPLNTVKTRMFYGRKHIAALLAARGIEQACL